MKILLKDLAATGELNKIILSKIPLGICITDDKAKILFANSFFTDRKQCLRCSIRPPVDIGETKIIALFDCPEGYSYEITRTSILIKNKKVYLDFFNDITRYRNAAKELQQSETKLRTIIQTTPVGIARFDNAGIIADCNDSYAYILGMPKEKIIGFNLLADKKNMRHAHVVQQALDGEVGIFRGFYSTAPNRKKIMLKVKFGPTALTNGVIDGGIIIIEDVTEREATKKKLKLHTNKLEHMTNDLQKFKLAVENASDAIIITNPDGKIDYANKVASTITGLSQKEMTEQGISILGRLVENKDYTNTIPFEKAWETIKTTQDYYTGELINLNKNGDTHITELHLAPVYNKEKNIVFFVATARDVTKIKEVDRAKTEFVTLASHQLRTPLAGISLAAELLTRNTTRNTKKQTYEYAKEIFSSTKKMSALINDLLNISRIEMGTFNINLEALDPVQSITAILDNLKSLFNEKNLLVKREFGSKIPEINFDKNAFNLIVENLLTNAIHYTPPEGSIRVNIAYENKSIIFSVSDTGCGIPAKESDKIFSKQFRASNAAAAFPEGTGLGLYIVKLMADRLGAIVWFAANADGLGTTFNVIIPADNHASNLYPTP